MMNVITWIILIALEIIATIVKIAVFVGVIALCTYVIKRIWKGKATNATTKEEK